ncbi:MAG: S8 family serine peptidase [Saprospiraceae bacterium]
MYQYQYGGKKGLTLQLTEASDLVVVRTNKPIDVKDLALSSTSKRLLSKMMPVVSFPEANVTVFKCIDKRKSRSTGGGMKLRNEVRKNFNQEKEIRFAGRVLKDAKSGEPVVYTENFFVKFKDKTPEKECEAIIDGLGLCVKEKLGFAECAYFICAESGTGMKIFDLSEQLLKNKAVEYCHPELVRQKKHRSIFPNQWHLRPLERNGQVINQHIDAELAWSTSRGEGITIAIVDDGVDELHEEFVGKIVSSYDTVLDEQDGNPKRSGESHGTACAGVACAAGRDKASGVAPEAMLMPIRSGGLGSLAEAKAFWWATDNGADIISCSWGPMDGPWWDSQDPQHFREFPLPDSTRLAIDYAINQGRGGKGCVIVWAAGNGNESCDLDGYASYPKVITVAASNDRGVRSYYSDYGQSVLCCFPSSDVDSRYVPVPRPQPLTPGIWTTDRQGREGYNQGNLTGGDAAGNYTNSFGGTSSSCPGVAGVAALMLGANNDLTWEEVRAIIKNSCDQIDVDFGDYDANGHSPFYGYGKINAARAVENSLSAKESEETLDYSVNGVAQFNKEVDVPITGGELAKAINPKCRLLSIDLDLTPFHPNLTLEYKTIINNKGATPWTKAGEVSGTTDRRRKLIGYAVRLKGDLANQYDVVYKAKIRKSDEWVTAKNGDICGTDKNRSQAVENIQIAIVKK